MEDDPLKNAPIGPVFTAASRVQEIHMNFDEFVGGTSKPKTATKPKTNTKPKVNASLFGDDDADVATKPRINKKTAASLGLDDEEETTALSTKTGKASDLFGGYDGAPKAKPVKPMAAVAAAAPVPSKKTQSAAERVPEANPSEQAFQALDELAAPAPTQARATQPKAMPAPAPEADIFTAAAPSAASRQADDELLAAEPGAADTLFSAAPAPARVAAAAPLSKKYDGVFVPSGGLTQRTVDELPVTDDVSHLTAMGDDDDLDLLVAKSTTKSKPAAAKPKPKAADNLDDLFGMLNDSAPSGVSAQSLDAGFNFEAYINSNSGGDDLFG